MGVAGPQGRERASREAIDSENRVIRCAKTASPLPLPGISRHRACTAADFARQHSCLFHFFNGMPAITIRPYQAADAVTLTRLFQASVWQVASRDYTPSHVRAWAPDIMDARRFGERCESKSTWVAEVGGCIAGFSDLEPDGHVDMLYVHPDFERRGVARALLEHLEKVARGFNYRRLYTEASITARPVFEALGFRVTVPQSVTLRGEAMTNYRMEKRLDAGPARKDPT